MAAAPIILMGLSTVMAASSAYKQASAASQAASYNAQVAQQNQAIAASQGAAAADMQTRQAEKIIGAATAGYGAAGVDASSGSPADVLSNSVQMATLDNLTTQYNYKLKGLGYQDEANLQSAASGWDQQGGMLSAAGALMGGAAQAWRYAKGGSTGNVIPQMG